MGFANFCFFGGSIIASAFRPAVAALFTSVVHMGSLASQLEFALACHLHCPRHAPAALRQLRIPTWLVALAPRCDVPAGGSRARRSAGDRIASPEYVQVRILLAAVPAFIVMPRAQRSCARDTLHHIVSHSACKPHSEALIRGRLI